MRVTFAVLLVLWAREAQPRGFKGIPGQYCSVRSPTCCLNRNDDCTVAILGDHLCYCDMFCDRGPDGGNDCCPDFEATCRGGDHNLVKDMNGQECVHEGRSHIEGESVRKNCETCTCREQMWRCDRATCLIQEDVLEKVQQGRYTWSPRNYSVFWGKSLEEGIKYRLGTLFPENSVANMNEIEIKPRELPEEFDAREKWPGLIHGIRDQGECGSSWALSTTTISADRLAIITDGRVNATLAPQQLLSCNQHRQKGCEGGYLDRAWWYIRKLGVVAEHCYPYESGRTQEPGLCRIPKSAYKSGNGVTCPSDPSEDSTVFKMTPPYRLANSEEDIMTEIITNGPVQATFLVHEDFFMYHSGVYQHTQLAQEKGAQYSGEGYHSVRVIGWGTDETTGRPVKYWLCANSWGEEWGENGYFRILRGENHCEIESFVIGAWVVGSLLVFCGVKREASHSAQKVTATTSKTLINTPKTAATKPSMKAAKSKDKVDPPKSPVVVAKSQDKVDAASQDKVDPANPEKLDPKAVENETYYGLVSAALFPEKNSKDNVEAKSGKKAKTPSSMKK